MEYVKCDYCDSNDLVLVVSQTDIYHGTTNEPFNVVQCRKCGFHFLNPRPSADEMGEYYSSAYDFHLHKTNMKLYLIDLVTMISNSRLHPVFNLIPVLNKRLLTYVKPYIKDPVIDFIKKGEARTMLDIGCGAGLSAHFWGRKGALSCYKKFVDVCGVDVADRAIESLTRMNITCYRKIEDIPMDKDFDIIRMNWSLEHVHKPSQYFDFINRHLSCRGRAIITVPNIEGLLYKIAIDCVELPVHLNHFRKRDIENYCGKFGLKILDFKTFSYPQMYRYLSEKNRSLCGAFSDMKLSAGRSLQKFLSRFDNLGLGNDMLFILSRN